MSQCRILVCHKLSEDTWNLAMNVTLNNYATLANSFIFTEPQTFMG